MTSSRPNDVLRGAADLIEAHGLCKGRYEDSKGRFCAQGAIMKAGVESNDLNEFMDREIQAEKQLADYLVSHDLVAPQRLDAVAIQTWNDARPRTAAQVVAILRAAAREGA